MANDRLIARFDFERPGRISGDVEPRLALRELNEAFGIAIIHADAAAGIERDH